MHQGPSCLHMQIAAKGRFWSILDFHSPTPAAPNRVQLPSEPQKHLLSSTQTFSQVQSFQHSTHTTKVLNHAQTHLSSQHFGFKPMKLFTTSYSCYSNTLLSININCCSKIPSIGRSCAAGVRDTFAWMTFYFPLLPTADDPGLTISCLPQCHQLWQRAVEGKKQKEPHVEGPSLSKAASSQQSFQKWTKYALI